MVRPVQEDARGIVTPAAGLAHFRLDRYPPSQPVARFVDRYWVATWDLRGRPAYTQQVLAHPVVNVVFTDGTALAHGVKSRIDARTLRGAGRALGIMFRPAGFRPFLDRPASAITDQAVPLREVFGPQADTLSQRVQAAADGADMAGLADRFLAAIVPAVPQPSEITTSIAERAVADPSLMRVDMLAAHAGIGVRQLQRRFSGDVGISAKALIRRYRLHEAAEQARLRRDVDWADLAAALSYSDQAHLSREFSALLGMPPGQYALACRVLRPHLRAAASRASRRRPLCSSSRALAASGSSR
jgi:AraC-like DNA-binding protein